MSTKLCPAWLPREHCANAVRKKLGLGGFARAFTALKDNKAATSPRRRWHSLRSPQPGRLADPGVQAVYIATPHPQHVEWAVRAAAAGKHVLCEKPAGLTHAEMVIMAEAARAHSVLFMEAFMYRCHPQTAKIVEMVRQGLLGEIKLIQSAFGFNAPFDPGSRLWSNATAGGGILDVGCYPVSMARLLAGAAVGAPFLDPVEVTGAGQLHPETGVDLVAAATLRFPTGLVAQVSS